MADFTKINDTHKYETEIVVVAHKVAFDELYMLYTVQAKGNYSLYFIYCTLGFEKKNMYTTYQSNSRNHNHFCCFA